MNLRSIRALFGLTSSFVLVAACTAPGGEQDESEGEDTAEVKQLMTGVQREPSGGIVKILVPNGTGTTVRTGVLIATNKVLTGLDAIPAGVNMASLLVSAPGEGSFAVASRADNSALGATLLTLTQNVPGPVWPINTAAPSGLLNHTVTCLGYNTSGTSLRANGVLTGAANPGYQVTFSNGSIDTTDDGVPCIDDTDWSLGVLGIALST